MIRGNTPWRTAATARLDWTAGEVPVAAEFGDVYYSRDDGAAESRHVFLRGNRLPERWLNRPAGVFRIGETGFGTGLNFLLTWQAWRSLPSPRPRLHYLAVELHPLEREDLVRALAPWPELAELLQQLLPVYPPAVVGQHRLLLEDGAIILDLWWEEATAAFSELAASAAGTVDAWYLDGFAPARNESMWTGQLFQALARLSRPRATLATFTVAGRVRRALQAAGFEVQRVPGFGRKRECLHAKLCVQPMAGLPTGTPWDLPGQVPRAPERALVIGAGLAGCHTARALARRGIQVILLDRGGVAGEASGNHQGVLYTRLSHRHSPLLDFALQSYLHAASAYRQLFTEGVLQPRIDGELCGSFQQVADEGELQRMAALLAPVPDLAQVVDAVRASELLGVSQDLPGYWYPGSGWLNPPAVCRALLTGEDIELVEHCGNLQLAVTAQGWLAQAADGRCWQADCAIVATGTAASRFPDLDWLPLRGIRGQTSDLPASGPWRTLRAVLCHEGYIPPPRGASQTIGASFDTRGKSTRLRPEDQRHNLQGLARAVPGWRAALDQLDGETLPGRVGFRCASPDYLPLVGPVPDRAAFLHNFAALGKNAKQDIRRTGDYVSGLYLNTGHGSRGLSSTPLAGELLASLICAEPLPLSRELYRALAPARFTIRDIRRGKLHL